MAYLLCHELAYDNAVRWVFGYFVNKPNSQESSKLKSVAFVCRFSKLTL